MRIIVTGGLGFIGSNFIRMMLSKSGTEVTNIDNFSYGSSEPSLSDLSENKDYHFIKGDIGDPDLMLSTIKEPGTAAIVNFAAETHVDRSISDPWPFFRSNAGGLLNILEAVRKSDCKVRVVQIGTDESYGDIASGSFTESDRLKPSSPYSASKASADLFALAYHRTYGMDVLITRCTNNFGPFQSPEKLIPKTIIRAKKGLKIPIYGSGKNVRDWIYVKDHCLGVKTAMERGRSGEVYNLSSGNELDNSSIVRKILKIMGSPESLIEYVDDRPGHDMRYSLDSGKARKELGWAPSFTFDQALSETVTWYSENEWWWRPLANERMLSSAPWKLKW